MYCIVCGQQSNEGNAYCQACGAPLDTTTGQSGAEEAYNARRHALLAEHELKETRAKQRGCLAAGFALGIAAGCFIGWAGTAYPSSEAPPVALLVLVAFAGGFFFPFGLTAAKDFLVERGVSKTLFWLIVLIFPSITFPACSIIGIPGIVLMSRRTEEAKRAIAS